MKKQFNWQQLDLFYQSTEGPVISAAGCNQEVVHTSVTPYENSSPARPPVGDEGQSPTLRRYTKVYSQKPGEAGKKH